MVDVGPRGKCRTFVFGVAHMNNIEQRVHALEAYILSIDDLSSKSQPPTSFLRHVHASRDIGAKLSNEIESSLVIGHKANSLSVSCKRNR